MDVDTKIKFVALTLCCAVSTGCGDDGNSNESSEGGAESSATTGDGPSTTGDGPSTTADGSSTAGAMAEVRIFHAAIVSDGNEEQGGGAGEAIALSVNIDVDGSQVAEGLQLYALTPRLPVSAGAHQVTVSDADGNVLYDESVTIPEGDSTVIAYNAAADFTAAELDLYPPIEEASIVGEAGEAGVLAVHLDGNSQGDAFLAYSGPFDSESPEALGADFNYREDSGVYSTSDFGFTHLDPDGGADYVFGFTCDTPGSAADGAYILVWGTNSVAPPGSQPGSFAANAFTLTADAADGTPLTSIGCAPQGG